MELRVHRVDEHRIGMEGGRGHCIGGICRVRVWNDECTQCKTMKWKWGKGGMKGRGTTAGSPCKKMK